MRAATQTPCVIENLPNIEDVNVSVETLRHLGAKVIWDPDAGVMEVDSSTINRTDVPLELCRRMRASSYYIGALLARFGRAQVPLPGGCDIGRRPIDQHIKGMRALGAKVETTRGMVLAEADELTGSDVFMDMVTVGGTINVMLAASRAKGITTIYNAAKEPHICGCIPTHMEALTAKLLEMGARVEERDDAIRVRSLGAHRAVTFKTQVYPGFPTDLQQPMSALLCTATGTSTVVENIFESRFRHLSEMERMGARVRIYEQTAVIEGVPQLHGAAVEATDLRGGAALVIAGLMAQGTTEIYNTHFIDRGYEHLEEKLNSLGAKISRTTD